ncbi:ABC transporter ATP-binding protein [Segnochrobactrum spirostomi]|uniref:Spermidine/putrescine import ATP-binding protein PotA n=1 Tax=Segnochrobactrum spirostomi TaxID=2608987 RepID=A0A6A7Y5V7_9HYPH|nr:ABC transporter ATP-binding protein [Segnochrobactrum spirostomi]MQT14166.1 ABC transporter ATP-binding protein [Segnochrobactrum spirostomi]
MLDIRELTKRFGSGDGAVTALHEVSFSIAEGEFFTLLGPSGCGKTTLLRLIAGFSAPSGGALVLDGHDIARMPPNQRPVNTVFQNYALFPHMTVGQNVAFALEAQGRPRAEITPAVEAMLKLVQLGHLKDRKSSELSGGQQQRVALARALVAKPRILLLDEPLSALDMKLRKEMQIELKRLQRETGLTFIFVTHDQEEALTMSDRIAVMSGGRVQQIATPRELYDRPANRFVAGFIGESNFLPAHAASGTVRFGAAAVALDGVPEGPVTLMIRPEHLALATTLPGALVLEAEIKQLVFFGTDTHVHLALPDGLPLVARVQNALHGGTRFAEGESVPVSLPAEALRVLADEGGAA